MPGRSRDDHGRDRHDRVVVIGRRHDHPVDRLLGIEHPAPVLVVLGVRKQFPRLRGLAIVAIAQGDEADARVLDVAEVVEPATADADGRERDDVTRLDGRAGVLVLRETRACNRERATEGTGAGDEGAAGKRRAARR